jgi:hypothetical protein
VEGDETEHLIRCHAPILAARCRFFSVALRSGFSEAQTRIITIPGASQPNGLTKSSLSALLLYFYTGRVDHISNIYDCLYILGAAEFLGIGQDHLALIIHCSYAIRHAISVKNVLDIFQTATRLGVNTIRERSLSFILSHYQDLCKDLPQLPMQVFMEINVAFNLRLLQKYGPL